MVVTVQVERKPAFSVSGKKVWITGQDNEQFAAFWREAHQNGLVDQVKARAKEHAQSVTHALIVGVSCVQNDPQNCAFDFYIASEAKDDLPTDGLETVDIPACEWAVFQNGGSDAADLIACEMHAFMQWLPFSGYTHANAQELEVYTAEGHVEFWLPVAPHNG